MQRQRWRRGFLIPFLWFLILWLRAVWCFCFTILQLGHHQSLQHLGSPTGRRPFEDANGYFPYLSYDLDVTINEQTGYRSYLVKWFLFGQNRVFLRVHSKWVQLNNGVGYQNMLGSHRLLYQSIPHSFQSFSWMKPTSIAAISYRSRIANENTPIV